MHTENEKASIEAMGFVHLLTQIVAMQHFTIALVPARMLNVGQNVLHGNRIIVGARACNT